MRANSRFARDAGLTLIELLVVLAILALLSGVLVTGIHTLDCTGNSLNYHFPTISLSQSKRHACVRPGVVTSWIETIGFMLFT
jgi:prepilin-type N-terminal cleavage/methylation domain-containing protein